MPQSSLTAWLKKPATVKQPHVETAPKDEGPSVPAAKKEQLPTPPTSSPEGDGKHSTDKAGVSAPSTGSLSKPILGSPRPPLPPNVDLRACTKEDISAFKRLNSLLLPIPYPESFYREILEDSLTNNITLLALWHDDPALKGKEKGRLVGAIRCRLLAHPPGSSLTDPGATRAQGGGQAGTAGTDGPMLYLSTLVLLSPYRHYGIATHMLNLLTKRAVDDYGISSIGAHVWEANDDGLEWYRKRGFRDVGREEGYYRRLNPSGAVVMQRQVSVLDFVEG